MAGEEPRLQGQQRERVRRANRVFAEHRAAVAVQARRQVDREHRTTRGIDALHGLRQRPVDDAVGAQPEQRVDDQIGLQVVGQGRVDAHAGLLRTVQCVECVGRQARRVAQQDDPNRSLGAVQVAGGDQAIAAVVARAAAQVDRSCMRRDGQRQACRGLAGARHQRVGGQASRCGLLDRTTGNGLVQRPAAAGRQHGAGRADRSLHDHDACGFAALEVGSHCALLMG